jgi:filamentous hemagglutinin family protein
MFKKTSNYSATSKGVFPTTIGLLAAAIFQASMPSIAVAQGLPTAGNVIHGQAHIGFNSTVMNITQSSDHAVIGWGTFDIAHGNSVNFFVPAGGATLNQVAGPASQINGSLTSNGALFLVNPNGVMFGNGANVNVGSLVATTNTVDHNEFMNNQQLSFTEGGAGTISNAGTITAGSGGYVVLAGAGDIGNSGVITVPGGTIQMVSADTFTLTLPTNNPFLAITVDGKASGKNVTNSGTLAAGAVTLNAVQGSVSTQGTIKATSIGDLKGSINISSKSTLDMSGDYTSDGDIKLSGGEITMKDIKLLADNNIKMTSMGLLSLTKATVHSGYGNLDLSSKAGLHVFNSDLKAGLDGTTANGGNITLFAEDGKTSDIDRGAVKVSGSTLAAAGKIKMHGQYQQYGLTHNRYGVHLKNSVLNAKTIEITGKASEGVGLHGSTLNANDILISGVGINAPYGIGVAFSGSTLIAQNSVTLIGVGDEAGLELGGGSITSNNTHVSGTALFHGNGIQFPGFVNLASALDTGTGTFLSNGVNISPFGAL